MKGFDFLSPEGVYDAIRAYGLPESIIALNKSALAANPCIPKTAYGPAERFITDNLTRQGGSISPLVSVLTTSLLHQWVDDSTKHLDGQVKLTTLNHRNPSSTFPLMTRNAAYR